MFLAPNFTQIPNDILDKIIPILKEGELRLLIIIMRQTFGWNKDSDRISLSQLATKSGMERRSVMRSLDSLIEAKIVKKFKSGTLGNEACWYRLNIEERIQYVDSEQVDYIDSNNLDQSPKDPTPRVLKTPGDQGPKDSHKRHIYINKEKKLPKGSKEKSATPLHTHLKISRVDSVETTAEEHEALVAKHGAELVGISYLELAAWKKSAKPQQVAKHESDYHRMTGWVINKVKERLLKEQELAAREKRLNHKHKGENNRALVAKLIEKYPDLGKVIAFFQHHIEITYNHHVFCLKYDDNGFGDQLQNWFNKSGITKLDWESIRNG